MTNRRWPITGPRRNPRPPCGRRLTCSIIPVFHRSIIPVFQCPIIPFAEPRRAGAPDATVRNKANSPRAELNLSSVWKGGYD